MSRCEKQPKTGDSIADVSFAGRSMEKASIFTTCGMSRVSQCIVIIIVVLIIVLPLFRIFGKAHSSSYYYAPHTTAWSNGCQKWGT
jgi:hypothetical protein